MPQILLKKCLLYNIEKSDFELNDILIEDKRIKKIGTGLEPESEKTSILNAREKYILPGLIDCHTHLGIIEEGTGKIGIDNNETSDPVTPQLRGVDAINPMDIAFDDAVRTGVTAVMSGPGSNNPVGGVNAVVKTHGNIIDKMIVKNPAGLKVALGENPISTYGKSDKCPVTRMGTASLIRELFMEAQDYLYMKENNEVKKRDIRLEAVIPVLKGEIPLRAHAHRADDIVTAIRIADEFKITKLVIEHGTEAHMVKEYLSEKKVPVAFGPMLTPRIKMELKRRQYSSALELCEAGVKVSLITDHPYNSIDQIRVIALLAISEGLNEKDALCSITTHPAEILQCQNQIGSIKPGLDADMAIYDGNPFDLNTKVIMTIIDGRIVYKSKGCNFEI